MPTESAQDMGYSPYLDNTPIALKHLSADAHINVMRGFKLAIERCNFLYSLIKSKRTAIIAAGRYDTVLQPIIEKNYLKNDDYFWVMNAVKNESEIDNAKYYFTWKKYIDLNNKTFAEIRAGKIGPYISLLTGCKDMIETTNAFNPTEANPKIYSYIESWDNNVQLCYKIYVPDLLDSTKLIEIGSSINLTEYLSPDLGNDPYKVPLKFINYINTVNGVIDTARKGTTQFTSSSIATSDLMTKWSTDKIIFEYNSDGTADNTHCLYSAILPEFTGKSISECVIPGSAVNYPAFIGSMMSDLNNSYRNLSEGQVVMSVFDGTDNRTHIAIVFVITYNGATAWVYQTIDFGRFITNAMDVSGDVTIRGTLNVQTFDKQDIVCIDNKSKIMTVFNKVGINQEASQVEGLLDIDNLSMNKLLSVLAEFTAVEKESFYALQAMISDSRFNNDNNDLADKSLPGTVTPVEGSGAPVVLRAPLKNIISAADLVKVGVPSSAQPTFLANTAVGAAAKLDLSSFSKMQQIVNELNKMKPEIAGYKAPKDPNALPETIETSENCESDFTYTFVEILYDTNFYYLSSMRAVIKTHSITDTNGVTTSSDYIYFVVSTLDITNTMIDLSYKSDMEKIVGKISRVNRYLNLSVLVMNKPGIYNKLFTNTRIANTDQNWVHDYINNNDYFSDNFGAGRGKLYASCYRLIGSASTIIEDYTSSYDKNKEYGTAVYHGSNPVWANKKSKDIYIDGTDIFLNNVTYTIASQTITQYGLTTGAQHMVNYTWVKGTQKSKTMAASCIYYIRGAYHRFSCWFDLESEIDNSITLKGDSSFGGDITVRNANNDIIYKIDNVNKTISNIYNVAIGKEVPTTKLDVKDSSTHDLVILIKQLGKQINNLNFNKVTIKNSADDVDSIMNTIENGLTEANVPGETQYTNTSKDYYTKSEFIQNPPAPTDDNWEFVYHDFILSYNFLMKPYWASNFGTSMVGNNNPQTNIEKKQALNNTKQIMQTTFLFDKSFNIDLVPWVHGKKVILAQTYKNPISSKLNQIRTGLDLQQYGLQFHTNSNISNFFNNLKYYQSYLSVMVANLTNTPLTSARYTLPFDQLNVDMRTFGKPVIIKLKMFTSSKNNQHLKSVVSILSQPYTPSPTSTLNNNTNDDGMDATASFIPDLIFSDTDANGNPIRYPCDVYNYADNNTMLKYQSLILNTYATYKTASNMNCFNSGDSGLVTFEDSVKYFLGLIYCINQVITPINANGDDLSYVELLILEKSLNDLALPSVLLGGDTEVAGEFVVADKSNTANGEISNYAVIDPHNKFMGVNTDERDIFYTYKFNTITNSNTIKQNLYVKNDKYPVAVFERLWESEEVDHSTGLFNIENGDGTTSEDPTYRGQFASFSALTAKRYSDTYDFRELYEYANKTDKKYGVDIAFEMRNLYMESQEIGHVGMVIDKTNDQANAETFDTTIQAGFLVTATEITTSGSSEKELLYVSNSGDLNVNSVILPQRTGSPSSSNPISGLPASPTAGQMVFVATGGQHYLYVCVSAATANNVAPAVWKRVLLSAI
jgi:hypothetical protein